MFRNVAAAGTRRALVEKGDADVSPDLPPREIADISAGKKFKVETAPMANTLKYLSLSTVTKPFDDVRVRQAVALRDPLSEGDRQRGVRARPAHVRGSGSAPADASWPQPFPYAYDPDKAKALLRDAGLSTRASNQAVLRRASGDDGRARRARHPGRARQARDQDFDREAPGLPGTAEPEELAHGDRPVRCLVRRSGFFFRWIWHGQNTVWNLASYKNPEMDRLLDAARQERDGAAYTALVKQFVKLAMTDVPVIPLYQPMLEVVAQPDIKGYAYMFHRQVDATTLYRG